jgi:hypothetical protein
MRLPFRIDLYRNAPLALLLAVASLALPPAVNAQEPGSTGDYTGSPTLMGTALLVSRAPAAVFNSESPDAFTMPVSASVPVDAALGQPADDSYAGGAALDDQVLSGQRGGASGMVMIAATPQMMRGNGVTLWDEIAPPSTPLPVPVDAARGAQGNLTTYSRNN